MSRPSHSLPTDSGASLFSRTPRSRESSGSSASDDSFTASTQKINGVSISTDGTVKVTYGLGRSRKIRRLGELRHNSTSEEVLTGTALRAAIYSVREFSRKVMSMGIQIVGGQDCAGIVFRPLTVRAHMAGDNGGLFSFPHSVKVVGQKQGQVRTIIGNVLAYHITSANSKGSPRGRQIVQLQGHTPYWLYGVGEIVLRGAFMEEVDRVTYSWSAHDWAVANIDSIIVFTRDGSFYSAAPAVGCGCRGHLEKLAGGLIRCMRCTYGVPEDCYAVSLQPYFDEVDWVGPMVSIPVYTGRRESFGLLSRKVEVAGAKALWPTVTNIKSAGVTFTAFKYARDAMLPFKGYRAGYVRERTKKQRIVVDVWGRILSVVEFELCNGAKSLAHVVLVLVPQRLRAYYYCKVLGRRLLG